MSAAAGVGGAAGAAVFDGLIQNAKGKLDSQPRIPLIIQLGGQTKGSFVCDLASKLFEGKVNNTASGLSAAQAASKAVQEAELLYNSLRNKGYIN